MTRMARIAAVAAAVSLLPGTAGAQANYGARVAAADGFVFVAEPENIARPGIVYAYRAGPDGQWTETAKLTVPDARAGDRFGTAVAAHGSVLLAARTVENEGRGVVHVFERRGEQWQHTGLITAADGAAQDSFGVALAVNGDVAAISAAGRNGAVYVFRRGSDGRWTEEAKLTAADAVADDRFGAALAVDANRVVVGAPGQANRRGAAYLFVREAAGPFGQPIKMVARTVTDGSMLGAQVALLRDYAVAAAPGRDENTGAVYLFEKNPQAEGWAAFTRLFPYEGGSGSAFGADVDVVGEELWVGSPGADAGSGAVYRFAWDEARADWVAAHKLSLPNTPGGTGFSSAFAIAGAVAIVGLPGDAEGDGAAVVLARADAGDWLPVSKLTSEPEKFPAITGRPVRCTSGRAELFECGGVELQGFLPISDIGGERGVNLNDIWGWTDPTNGREYALVGRTNGTSFVDVTDPTRPRYLGDLPMTEGARANAWRDIKVYKDHAFIVADGAGKHGMQVFDLTQLRNVREPKMFTATTLYENIFSAHNIVINEATGVAFAVGSNGGGETCGGGLHMIDIREPKNPTFFGCFADPQTGLQRTGYSHDAQCVVYKGPHAKYQGREICFGSNETHISIADVTDRKNPIAVGRAAYPNVSYSHQGWLTEDQRFFYMDDEGDELEGSVPRTRTIIWDVTDLEDPQVAGEFLGVTAATDHNLYIVGDTMYQSNYRSGLRVIDISDRKNPKEIGFFDSVPNSENNPGFQGSWSNYPFFKSGNIVFTSIREGLFIVRMQRPVS
jgi:choice-of-anchor B domain-containing protein